MQCGWARWNKRPASRPELLQALDQASGGRFAQDRVSFFESFCFWSFLSFVSCLFLWFWLGRVVGWPGPFGCIGAAQTNRYIFRRWARSLSIAFGYFGFELALDAFGAPDCGSWSTLVLAPSHCN